MLPTQTAVHSFTNIPVLAASDVEIGAGVGLVVGLLTGFATNLATARILLPAIRFEEITTSDDGSPFEQARHSDHDGVLYKLRFKLTQTGRFARWTTQPAPGTCAFEIRWRGPDDAERNVLGKWDETPNPFDRDIRGSRTFRRERVPLTYYQPLFLDREYRIPILMKDGDRWRVFSGWWFGERVSFSAPDIHYGAELSITVTGTGFQHERKIDWATDIDLAPPDTRSDLPSLYGESA
jgi:hypothetical protein